MWEMIAGSAAANIAGSLIQANETDNAVHAQSETSAAALGENRRQFDLSRSDLLPYRTAGGLAIGDIQRSLGIRRAPGQLVSGRVLSREEFDPQAYLAANPDIANSGNQRWLADPYSHYLQEGQQGGAYRPASTVGEITVDPNAPLQRKFTMEDFQNDPVSKASFEFGLSEGEKAVKRMFGSRGMSRSGAAVKALTRFATDYTGTKAGESYNRFYADQDRMFNRDAAVAGIGQTATTTTAQLGANMATNAGNILTAEGNARGAASIARGNNFAGAISGVGNNMMNMYTMDRILDRSGSTPAPALPRPAFYMDDAYSSMA